VYEPLPALGSALAPSHDPNSEEGLPSGGVASMDNVLPFPKSLLVRRIGSLAPDRRGEPRSSLRAATDC
jgi:mRNA-degrading endonuclease toxin of MazEF toxin-antitoxin module